MRICPKCLIEKLSEDFYRASKRCKVCVREENRLRWAANKDKYRIAAGAWRTENREALLSDYQRRGQAHRDFIDTLKGEPCVDCGESHPPFAMEFDHVRGDKRWAIGKMSNHRREAVLQELAKCELVCCACHRVRSHSRRTSGQHTWKYGEWSSKRQAEFHAWLAPMKSKPCADCGRVRPIVAMDFDHVSGVKTKGISSMWSWSKERILTELSKCELVCCICHRIRTQSRRSEQEAA